VIWARDLGAYQNQALLEKLRGRKVWSLSADNPVPQLAPYSDNVVAAATSSPAASQPEESDVSN